MKSLRDIYDQIISCAGIFYDVNKDLLRLNSEYLKTTETSEWMQDWMIEESVRIQGQIRHFASKLWDLPEVNQSPVKGGGE